MQSNCSLRSFQSRQRLFSPGDHGGIVHEIRPLAGLTALPAQTLVPVPKLAIDPMLFEVEAVVALE